MGLCFLLLLEIVNNHRRVAIAEVKEDQQKHIRYTNKCYREMELKYECIKMEIDHKYDNKKDE